MKKTKLLSLITAALFSMQAIAQEEYMVVQKTNGTKVEYPITDVEKVYFYQQNEGYILTTGEATDITYQGATISYSISGISGDNTIGVGIEYGKEESLSDGIRIGSMQSNGAYIVKLSDLKPERTYYYRAYAYTKSDGKYYYGEIRSFTTAARTYKVAEPVDLGLSVKWANWNIGAESELESGGFYGWGDSTGEKNSDSLDDYPCPFPPDNISGTEYDIAKNLWGEEWRLPTKEEVQELISTYNCKWTKGSAYGISYFKVTGKNGNFIYLPISGCSNHPLQTYHYWTNEVADYWTGTLKSDDTKDAYVLEINEDNSGGAIFYRNRNYGVLVRPVYNEIIITTGNVEKKGNSTSGTATLYGTIKGVYSDVEVGFFYSTDVKTSISEYTKVTTKSSGDFNLEVADLPINTIYYYFAYAKIGEKYYYGDVKSFSIDASYRVGDLYPNSSSPIGVVFYTSNDGVNGKIVSLDYATNKKWDINGAIAQSANCKNVSDGSKNTMPSNTSPVGQWCYNHGDGWYCPARGELITIGSNLETINKTLNSINYEAIPAHFYWSSTQYLSDTAYIVCVGDAMGYSSGWYGYNTKDQTRNVVAVKQF